MRLRQQRASEKNENRNWFEMLFVPVVVAALEWPCRSSFVASREPTNGNTKVYQKIQWERERSEGENKKLNIIEPKRSNLANLEPERNRNELQHRREYFTRARINSRTELLERTQPKPGMDFFFLLFHNNNNGFSHLTTFWLCSSWLDGDWL